MVFDSTRLDLRPYAGFAMERYVRRTYCSWEDSRLGVPARTAVRARPRRRGNGVARRGGSAFGVAGREKRGDGDVPGRPVGAHSVDAGARRAGASGPARCAALPGDGRAGQRAGPHSARHRRRDRGAARRRRGGLRCRGRVAGGGGSAGRGDHPSRRRRGRGRRPVRRVRGGVPDDATAHPAHPAVRSRRTGAGERAGPGGRRGDARAARRADQPGRPHAARRI